MTSQLSGFRFEVAKCSKNDEDILWVMEVSRYRHIRGGYTYLASVGKKTEGGAPVVPPSSLGRETTSDIFEGNMAGTCMLLRRLH